MKVGKLLIAALCLVTAVSAAGAGPSVLAGRGEAAPRPANPYTEEWLAANHGKYDNVWTAEYEQRLQTGGGLIPDLLEKLGLAPLYGADIRQSSASFNSQQNEFQIDINPNNSQYVIGTSNDYMTAGVGIYRSSDGGATWSAMDAPIGTSACCDPGIAYAFDGSAYAVVLDTSPAQAVVIRSTDNGLTWGTPSAMAVPDRENIVVDNGPTSPHRGRVYVTYSFAGNGNQIGGYYSDNQGSTWMPTGVIGGPNPPNGYEQSSQPRVASDGTVYVGYQQYINSTTGCSAGVQNVVSKSTDGGATWTQTVLDIVQGGVCLSTQAGRGVFCTNSGGSNFRSRSHPIMGVSPTNPQHVYMVYSGGDLETAYSCAGGSGFHSDTLFRKSTDGGATWTAPMKVNQDGQGKDQYYPWIDVAPNGTIVAGWHDRRDDVDNYRHKWYEAYSTDEGATWTESAVADVQSQPATFIGDYAGIAIENNKSLGMWWDSRIKSTGDPYTDPNTPPGPPSGTCEPGAWTTTTTGPSTRYRAGATSDGTYVYVYGGQNNALGRPAQGALSVDGVNAALNDLWRFNPGNNSWTQLANMPTAKGNIQGSFWNGKIYVPGGYTGAHIAELAIYDIAGNSWTTGAPLPTVRSGTTAAYNGKIYVFGGNPGPSAQTLIYDIATNTWSTGADMPVPITYGRSIVAGSYIYYVGGIANGSTTTDTVYRYNPAANTWATMAPLQTARTSEELMTEGTHIFAVNGGNATFFTGIPLSETVEVYDIASNTWTYAAPTTQTSAAPAGGLAGNKLMIQGGVDGANYYDTVQISPLQCSTGYRVFAPVQLFNLVP